MSGGCKKIFQFNPRVMKSHVLSSCRSSVKGSSGDEFCGRRLLLQRFSWRTYDNETKRNASCNVRTRKPPEREEMEIKMKGKEEGWIEMEALQNEKRTKVPRKAACCQGILSLSVDPLRSRRKERRGSPSRQGRPCNSKGTKRDAASLQATT